jgi:predicted HAD superfamily Cof-like phosphohydrolase
VNSFNDVAVFMEACDQTSKGFCEQSDLYLKLVREDFEELMLAYKNQDIVEIADACADLKWVIEGLENTLELPQQEVWNEVSRSNLSKISPSGKVLKREDGKVLKPEGWTPPNIKLILENENE